MIAGLGNDRPTVAVADQNHGPLHGVDSGFSVLLIVRVGRFGGLCHRNPVPIVLEDLRDRFPAGAVSESSMYQKHVLNMRFHGHSPFQDSLARSDFAVSSAAYRSTAR